MIQRTFILMVGCDAVAEVNRNVTRLLEELKSSIGEAILNQIEPKAAEASNLPKIIHRQCGQYRRENEKSPNRNVATRFGTITLWRYSYRFRQRESESAIFPLEMKLGLVEHATPNFADTVAREMAEAGAVRRASSKDCGASIT